MTGISDHADRYTIGHLVGEQALANQTESALVSLNGSDCTYADIDALSRRIAKSLLALDIRAGSHVAIWALNSPQWVVSMAGAARAGLPFIGLNTGYRAGELRQVLTHSGAVLLFIGESSGAAPFFSDIFYESCPGGDELPPGTFSSADLSDLRYVVSFGTTPKPGMMTWDEFLSRGDNITDSEADSRQRSIIPGDLAMIMYTSGTTGKPKGVMHTHRDLILNASLIAEGISMSDTDIACLPMPFFHIIGIMMLFSSLATGGRVALVERFSPVLMLQTMETFRATLVYGVVTVFAAVLNELKNREYDLSVLRSGMIAGSRCPPELVSRIIDEMNIPGFMIVYGSTEAGCITMSALDDSLMHKTETLGRSMPGVQITIMDPCTGEESPSGETGEIRVRCPWMMSGYYQMPDATARVLDSSSLYHTGDLAFLDEDGYYRFIGRIDELIIRGGENVYAIEIEEPLRQHPAVLDARAVGIPCEYYGEDIIVFVILKPEQHATPLEIKKYLRTVLAMHKVPSQVIIIDSFPLTGSGKVHLSALREMAISATNST